MSRNRFTTLLSTVRTWAHIKTRTTQSEARCTTDPPGELHHATHLSTPSRHTSPPIDTPTGPLTPTSHRTLTPIDTITEVPTPTGRPIDASSSDQVQVAQPTSIHDSVSRNSSISSRSRRTRSDSELSHPGETTDFWVTRLQELQQSTAPLTPTEFEEALRCVNRIRVSRNHTRTEARARWREYEARLQAADLAVEEVDRLIQEYISWALQSGMSSTTLHSIINQ